MAWSRIGDSTVILLAVHSLGHDAGACIFRDGRLLAAVESERISRRRHDDDPVAALDYVLALADATPASIDIIVLSTDVRRRFAQLTRDQAADPDIRAGQLHRWTHSDLLGKRTDCLIVAHEVSHAALACQLAGWPESLLVLVNEGHGSRSRNSTFTLHKGRLTLESLDALPWYGTGFGWLALAYLAGFGSSPSAAGKVMAMGGYGTATLASADMLRVIPADTAYVSEAEQSASLAPLMQFFASNSDFARRSDVIRTFQELFTNAVTEYCVTQLRQLGSERLALAGGCALNLPTNSSLRDALGTDVIIPPNCNDAGQALGAAVYAFQAEMGVQPEPFSVYSCGAPLHSPSARDAALTRGLVPACLDPSAVARQLAAGDVVGIAQGAAELGPRALGNRSLLASANLIGARRRVSQVIKGREWFRPLGCVMRDETFRKFFPAMQLSPYMLFNYQMPTAVAPEATHVDGSSRIQTVSESSNPVLWDILRSYEDATGECALINTSLNAAGKPICLTAEDVLEDFSGKDVASFIF